LPFTILQGEQRALDRHPLFAEPNANRVVLQVGDFPVPFFGVRTLVAFLRARLGDAAVEDGARRARGALSLVFRKLQLSQSDQEAKARDRARASLLGFLSHNAAIMQEVIQSCSELVVALLRAESQRGGPLTIAIPNAYRIDSESLGLLRAAARDLGASAPHIVIGFDPEMPALEHSLWQRRLILNAGHVALLEAQGGTVVEDVAPTSDPAAPAFEPTLLTDPWDDGLEGLAASTLNREPLDAPHAREILDATRAAFAGFGYEAVLRLGLGLLEKKPPLTRAEWAEIHLLVAIAAYNRQVRTEGDPNLAEILEHHFRAALALEEDPIQRSHILYRLTINQGRRKGDVGEALRLADESVAIAVSAAADRPGPAAFVEAWARNGRAYVYARQRRMPEAIADCEIAFERLRGLAADPSVPRREAEYSPLVIADNLAELHTRAKDRDRAREWQAKLASLEVAEWGKAVISHWRHLALAREDLDLAAAQAWAARGLELARESWDPLGEDAYAAALGEVLYRRGDVHGAIEALHGALVIRRRAAMPEDVRAMEVAAAIASIRAARFDDARDHLERADALDEPDALGLRAQIAAIAGYLAGVMGDAAGAEAMTNEAISFAVESGERDSLLRVARWAGDTCCALSRVADARTAWARALEIASAGEEGAPPPPADELFLVHAGLFLECGLAEHLDPALACLPVALHEPEPWWRLARFVESARAREGLLSAEQRRRVTLAEAWLAQRLDRADVSSTPS
jgi:tetratricopeptide (TPR) repeat protein